MRQAGGCESLGPTENEIPLHEKYHLPFYYDIDASRDDAFHDPPRDDFDRIAQH
jgi:hypothetical protein